MDQVNGENDPFNGFQWLALLLCMPLSAEVLWQCWLADKSGFGLVKARFCYLYSLFYDTVSSPCDEGWLK